jgi:hypothetical protein
MARAPVAITARLKRSIARKEARLAEKDVDAKLVLKPLCRIVLADVRAYAAHPLHDGGEVHLGSGGDAHPEVFCEAQVSGHAGGADQGLRRHAPDVQAIAAHQVALDDRDTRAQTCGTGGRHQARGSRAEHDQVIARCGYRVLPGLGVHIRDQRAVVRIVSQHLRSPACVGRRCRRCARSIAHHDLSCRFRSLADGCFSHDELPRRPFRG